MYNKEDLDVLNQKLLEYLLTIPFPYGETLREQLAVSRMKNVVHPDLYGIDFEVDKTAGTFPTELPSVPLSWTVETDGAPILCQLFVKAGYVESFEVIDMGLENIKWDYLWKSPPTYEQSRP